MQAVIRILFFAAPGAGCGCGALFWSHWLLQKRNRGERASRPTQCTVVIAAAICGGIIGLYSAEWLPAVFAMAVLTASITAAVSDWLCRLIPNPTVLAVLFLKCLLIAGGLLKIPGFPSPGLLSAFGGMVFCFLLFLAPGLMGKQVGAGDIKLAAAMGFLLGFNGALLAVVVMGALLLGYCMFQQRMPLLMFLKTNIPMGPFIAAGMMIAFMVPHITS